MKYLFLFVAFFAVSVPAQVPLATHVEILKAEDARRYDKTLEDLLKSQNAAIRTRAALAAGRIGRDEAVPALIRMLDDTSPKVRQMAAFALGEIASIRAADAVMQAIGETARAQIPGEVGGVDRSRLVEAAGKIAAANAKDPKAKDLARSIVFTLEAELAPAGRGDKETIMLGLTAALRARPERAEETVRKFLAFTDPDIVGTALNTLARLQAKNANRDARDLLATHTHAIVRANAARVLGAAGDKDAVDVLIKAATSDVDQRVRVSAIRALAAIRDAKAADLLLTRGEALFVAYKKEKRPDFIPRELNEFIEIATALGRLLPNTRSERAVNLFREFGKLDRGFSTEVYLARLRIAPGRGGNDEPDLSHWQQYSTLAQVIGEFAAIEPTNDEGKRMKSEAPGVLRPLAKAFAEADPAKDNDTILAGPEVLRAYARFKTDDLSEVLRTALTSKDVFIRATAAELLSEQPVSQDNLDALNSALDYAIVNDAKYNDAVLATIDALYKLDKRKSLSALALASGSLDHLVRTKVLDLLKDEAFRNVETLPPLLRYAETNHLREAKPYSGKASKLGQILSTDADYRRAIGRKNRRVHAIVTTRKGAFTIDLLPEDAPLTVDNFIKLARSGYFNGIEVHRVVPNFVMQDGDPRGDGNGGPGWSMRCEINMVPYERGAVGMALSGKDTGGSQWFVTHSPQPHLDGGYTVFGRVNDVGMKVVDNIVRGDKIVSVRIVGR